MREKIEKTLKLFIEDFLTNYPFSFNNEDVRKEIKEGIDNICEIFLQGGLIYEYRNVCDETNNHKYVIDLQMGVSDTYIRYEKDGEVFVYNTTILKKGCLNIDVLEPTFTN